MIPINADLLVAMESKLRQLAESAGAPTSVGKQKQNTVPTTNQPKVFMSKPIAWLAPTNFPGPANIGLPIIPWLSMQQDPFDQTDADLPTDACIRRIIHYMRCEGLRGEKIPNMDSYIEKWVPRLKKEASFKIPVLRLVVPDGEHLYPTMEHFLTQKEHNRIAAGEPASKRINSKVTLVATNKTKHDHALPLCPTIRSNIMGKLPSETKDLDLDLAQNLLQSNLARSTRKHNNSVQKTLSAMIPERNLFTHPKPGDKELLLLRLTRLKPHLATSTIEQYLKTYNSILLDKGLESSPDSALLQKMRRGLRNKDFNPRLTAQKPKRQAHTTETLSLLTHALASMGPRKQGPWEELRVQALFTAALIAFWGCARLSDLCGAQPSEYSMKTTLLEKDFSLMYENGKVTGLEIFFGSEKVQRLNGSRVQLPKIPQGPLQKLCPVNAYLQYQKLKRPLRPRASAPWLIDHTGKPILQRNLTPYFDQAINKTFGHTKHIQFLRKLRGHSFRAALPTHMQAMGEELTPEEKKLMGRWLSEAAYRRYCKNKTSRLNTAKLVVNNLQSAQQNH